MKLVFDEYDIKSMAFSLNEELISRIGRGVSVKGAEDIVRCILRKEMEDRKK